MKKAISLGVAAAMAATLLAGCGTAASSAAASSEAASTADSTTAESTAASEAAPSEAHEINTTDPIELTISWWGGDSRHEAYQKALEAFHEKYPNITVSPTYGAWSGWEEKQSTALAAHPSGRGFIFCNPAPRAFFFTIPGNRAKIKVVCPYRSVPVQTTYI